MPNGRWRTSTRRIRLPADWDERRDGVLERDPICRICHAMPSVEADHIVPNDDHSPANLQGACHRCHLLKSSAEGGRAAQVVRGRRRRPPDPHPGIVR